MLLKLAVKEEFRQDAPVWKQGRHKFKPEEIADARQAIRRLYEETQAYFEQQGVERLTLMRGVDTPVYQISALEGWTSDLETAQKFGKSRINCG